MKDIDADLVIVGMGLSTGPIINKIIEKDSGVRILVLDRGHIWNPDSENHPSVHDVAEGSALSTPMEEDYIMFRQSARDKSHALDKWWASRAAGGGNILWYGQLSRFGAEDFRMRTIYGKAIQEYGEHELQDWPISLKDMEPYYRMAEADLKPYWCDYGALDKTGKRFPGVSEECEIFTKREKPSHFEKNVIDTLGAKGINSYVGFSCLGGKAWDDSPVDPLSLDSHKDRRPLLYRPNWYTKILSTTKKRDSVRVLGGSYVSKVLYKQGQASGLRVLVRNGKKIVEMTVNSPNIVLGCGSLETIRIILNSGLKDKIPSVGRGVTFTTEAVSYGLSSIARPDSAKDNLAGLFSNISTRDFYRHGNTSVKGGKISIYDAYNFEIYPRHKKAISLRNKDWAEYIEKEKNFYGIKASFKGESIPWAGKYTSLSTAGNMYGDKVPQVTYKLHPHDFAVRQDALNSCNSIIKALGGDPLKSLLPEGRGLVSAHHHGGLCFGDNPSEHALDRNCKLNGVNGVFAVDGSFMPTSGGTNSSLTIMANAYRVFDSIKERLAI